MMTEASRTSVWAAVGRALGAREPDPCVRNPDYLAERLLGPEQRALLGDHPLSTAVHRPWAAAYQLIGVVLAARILVPRTRFIEGRLEAAVHAGATQVVLLGAGFDSRGYRLQDLLGGSEVFEVDHPATQAMKR